MRRVIPTISLGIATTVASQAAGGHGVSYAGLMVYIGITLLVVFTLLIGAKKGINSRFFTNPLTQKLEQLYLFIESLCLGIVGPHGKKYMPMMMTFWLVIFFANLISLFFPTAPTADLSFNLGMALIAIGYVQWEGIKANGVIGHFSHFAGPKLGLGMIPITLMIFVIEIISEMMKNVSLSLRLFGNIEGGHQAVVAMNKLGDNIMPLFGDVMLSIPIGFFLMPIKLLTCVVQALIFTLLTCVYISLVTHHEHDDHHEEGHGELAAAH